MNSQLTKIVKTFVAFLIILTSVVSARTLSYFDDIDPAVERAAIVGGHTAPNRPFYVSVNHIGGCGGTIVSSTLVVTAAHCVYGEQQPVKVIYGDFTDEVKFTDEEKTKEIYGDVTVHEGYARPRECDVQEGCDENENDIAVIKLRSEVPRR